MCWQLPVMLSRKMETAQGVNGRHTDEFHSGLNRWPHSPWLVMHPTAHIACSQQSQDRIQNLALKEAVHTREPWRAGSRWS